jgi:hypothetical protein
VLRKLIVITKCIQVLRRKLRLGSAIHYLGITSWLFTFSLSETKVSLYTKQMIKTFFLRLIRLFVLLYPVQHSNYCCRVSCSFICLFCFFHLVRYLLLPIWTAVILSLFFVNFILFSPPLKIVSLYTTCFFLVRCIALSPIFCSITHGSFLLRCFYCVLPPAQYSTAFVFSSLIILNLIFILQVPFSTTVFVYDFSPFVTKFPLHIFLLLDALFYVTEFIFLYLYEDSAKDTLYASLPLASADSIT